MGRKKMNLHHNRIPENLLFVLLIASVAGWITAPMAADLQSATAASTCLVAGPPVHRS
jgi:hypothetical protein